MPDLTDRENKVLSAITGDLPEEPDVDSALLSELRRQLADSLGDASTGSVRGEVRIDSYRLKAALNCPASTQEESEFRWSTLFAARGLALGALGDMPDERVDLLAAVHDRIAADIAVGKSLGIWLGSLPASALGAVVVSASAWATRVWLSAPWRSLERVVFTPQSTWYRPLPRSNAVVLVGRPDAMVIVHGTRIQERVLVRIGNHDPVAMELDVLVASLDRGRAPLRYVTISPATGEIMADAVGEAMLRSAVDRVELAFPVLAGRAVKATPGPHCRWCKLRPDCPPGKDWMKLHGMIGRLPVAAVESELASD
ncbi:MAG: hypothetical protein ACYDGN_13125 [Acidimicrobiales bacterium]